MHQPIFLQNDIFRQRTEQTLHWLRRSIEQGGSGSAAYYHLWRGWAPPYPETTGYIIETLFDYGDFLQEKQWNNLAINSADWLCSIQRADRAFPGGAGVLGEPLIFDTGQILFGLTRAYLETGDQKYKTVLEQAMNWLLNNLESDGSWQKFAYQPGYTPSYYTRVVWAILNANRVLKQEKIEQRMSPALNFYLQKINPDQAIQNWAFAPHEAAFTHTIAYTLRGMIESIILLKRLDLLSQPLNVVNKIIALYQDKSRLAGRYDSDWQGDYSFSCVTGDAQMTVLFARAYQITNNPIYLNMAIKIFEQTALRQWKFPSAGLQGAIPGSAPIWGKYQRFRFPNWAAKFYLDAYLILVKLQSS